MPEIFDGRLLVRHALGDPRPINDGLRQNQAYLAHLLNQLLLHDTVILPTHDFGVLWALLDWFGVDRLLEMFDSGAIRLLHKKGLLVYAGGGASVSTVLVQPAKGRRFQWWQEALFGGAPESACLQLEHYAPILSISQKTNLLTSIERATITPKYDVKDFVKEVVDETFADIVGDSTLRVLATGLSPGAANIDLRNLPQVAGSEARFSSEAFNDTVDLVLHVAETNFDFFLADKLNIPAVVTGDDGQKLVRAKLHRCKVPEATSQGFQAVLDLESIPDLGVAVVEGVISIEDLWQLRQSSEGAGFRRWVTHSAPRESREMERSYIESLKDRNLFDRAPLKAIRFVATTGAGLVGLVPGLVASALDSFCLSNWRSRCAPRMFLEKAHRILGNRVC